MSEALSHDEEAAVLERIVRNQLAIKELEEENTQLKQFIKERPEQYTVGLHQRGRFYVKVTTNQRIDDKLARQYLTADQRAQVSKQVIDPVYARRVLTEEQIKKITKVYDNKLEIGLTD